MNLVPFKSWADVLAYARSGRPLYYQAPMDQHPTRFLPGGKVAFGYEARGRTIKMWPSGSIGRGRNRTHDPFSADSGHLDRFSRPEEEQRVASTNVEASRGTSSRNVDMELIEYARLTAADNNVEREDAIRMMLDELGEVSRETGIPEETIRKWCNMKLRDAQPTRRRGSGPLPGGTKGWTPFSAREAEPHVRENWRDYSMTYGELPPFEKFERDIRRPNPENSDGGAYWPEGVLYPMELVSAHEIELAETFGLEEFRAERQITGRNTRVRGFRDNERAIYEFIEFLVDRWHNGDEEAGDLASSIMYTLGYEWI